MVNSEGWKNYLEAIDIRGRLTHPKVARQLEVQDEEYERCIVGTATWFAQEYAKAYKGLQDGLAAHGCGLDFSAHVDVAVDGRPGET